MVMTVKRVLSIMALTVMMVCLFMSVEPAVALADNNTYYGADSYGAYKLTYSGRRADIDAALNEVAAYYPANIIERARAILYQQRKKYQYLFDNSH